MNKCTFHSGYKSPCGDIDYDTCFNDAKYEISFITGARGKMGRHKVCGVHKNQIQNQCNKVNKRLGYDYSKLNITDITP